ncbi:CobQ/CobB/MinD/ParA nucleotide binding domain [Geoglobus ahangari]|uniref:CobQ/CobB/MinD/ParA nucleotide binding domain n=1 Tax=Geoglobus ahangari TaxID=113653 RepID=A0A0F7IH08_9EURY|nr:AAA family ATPase [Geoglobus ahangari]AKG91987.1 CobQ/CobB/MinD/ParA nucleotide binding domain [Geoglobus ahangari]
MIVGLHSFKGGSGKTFVALNAGYMLSQMGRTCIVEMDMRGPSMYTFFNGRRYVNELLNGRCGLEDCLVEVKENLDAIVASPEFSDIRDELVRKDVESIRALYRLQDVMSGLKEMGYEFVIIDNSPGLGYMSINSMFLSDIILFIARPERAELGGLEMLFKISRNIEKPKYVVLNRANTDVNIDFPVLARIPCSCDVVMNYPFFVEQNPDHPVTKAVEELVQNILSEFASS